MSLTSENSTVAYNFGSANKGGNIVNIRNAAVGSAVTCGGVFYAYTHNRRDDNTYRIVIIFSSREVADEWWRAVSTSEITQLKDYFQRITPQFYNHDQYQWNFLDFFTDLRVKTVSDLFRGKMFMVLENDRGGRGITIVPPQCIVDYTSGSSFCIRSKSDPQRYWDIDEEGRIYVSVNSRASFVVTANDVNKNTIMIGSDEVTLNTSHGAVVLKSINSVSAFVTTSASEAGKLFRFKDLKEGRFFVDKSGLVCFDDAKIGVAWELAM